MTDKLMFIGPYVAGALCAVLYVVTSVFGMGYVALATVSYISGFPNSPSTGVLMIYLAGSAVWFGLSYKIAASLTRISGNVRKIKALCPGNINSSCQVIDLKKYKKSKEANYGLSKM